MRRFTQDDAFISMRYAKNLADGFGLVFNPGEHVEGYTNFLWTVWLAIPLRLGVEPVLFGFLSGMVLFAAVLLLSAQLARSLLPESPVAPLFVVAILGCNHSFSAYATGGLETMLQTFWSGAALALTMSDTGLRSSRIALVSIVGALALMTRPDSPLLLLPAMIVLVTRARGLDGRQLGAALTVAIVPGALVILAWLWWKLSFYGSLLPNTARVKTAETSWLRGCAYLGSFSLRYLVLFAAPLAALAWRRRLRDESTPWRSAWFGIGVTVVIWLLYLAKVGGDFMEFRMMVPVLPWITVLVVAALADLRSSQARALAVGALLVAGLASPLWPRRIGPQPTAELAELLDDWSRTGKVLSELAPAEPKVVVAVTAAGAIPYYSNLTTIDLLGLNDEWIARHGEHVPPDGRFPGSHPGHSRIAPPSYLAQRGVHLLLNHPWLAGKPRAAGLPFTRAELSRWPHYAVSWKDHPLPPAARLLEIPVDDKNWLLVLQLRPHPAIDARVAEGRWRSFPVIDEEARSLHRSSHGPGDPGDKEWKG